jgi:hypothetical protein
MYVRQLELEEQSLNKKLFKNTYEFMTDLKKVNNIKKILCHICIRFFVWYSYSTDLKYFLQAWGFINTCVKYKYWKYVY